MPDPIQTICSRTPGAIYDPQNNTCRWTSELGSQIEIFRDQDGTTVIRGVGQPEENEAPPLTNVVRSAPFNDIGISKSAISRLYEIQSILINRQHTLTPAMIDQLINEQSYLIQALDLGCSIRIMRRMLAKEGADQEALNEMVRRINDNINSKSVPALTDEAREALCEIFNDPRVDLPTLSDELWNLICD